MFRQLADLLKGPASKSNPAGDLRQSVAILLLEAAKMDDMFSPLERRVIEKFLTDKFALSPSEAQELLSVSEEKVRELVQLHPHTNACFSQMDESERIHLIEMLWEVVYADGVLDPDEEALVRRLAELIHVPTRERIFARQRVLAKKGLTL
jgi:uncharacterized tellurite resistance protein B-like protein